MRVGQTRKSVEELTAEMRRLKASGTRAAIARYLHEAVVVHAEVLIEETLPTVARNPGLSAEERYLLLRACSDIRDLVREVRAARAGIPSLPLPRSDN